MAERGDGGPSALGHLRVVEVGGPSAACCAFWLAGLGADVVKVEPPGGDRLRSCPPFAGDIPDNERGLFHLHFDQGKRSIVLDLEEAEDRERFLGLLGTADILVESFPPGYLERLGLGYQRLHQLSPGLVVVSVTPFGQTGPHRDYLGDDLIALASSGYMSWAGDDQRAPCVAPCFQAYQLGGLFGAFAALLALRHRAATGSGQWVDLSLQQALVASYGSSLIQYLGSRQVIQRVGPGSFSGHQIYRCQDGYIIMSPFNNRSWKTLAGEWMKDPLLSQEPYLSDRDYRVNNADVIDALIQAFTAQFQRWDFIMEAQERHIQCAPVNGPADFLTSEHIQARGLVVEMEHPIVGRYKTLRSPFGLSATPWGARRPAPLLDQHREELLTEARPRATAPRGASSNGPTRLPLEGIRVLDFTRVRSGPAGTAILTDYGAQMIRIESATVEALGGQGRRTAPHFDDTNRTKQSITLNLKDPRARDLFLELVKQSDVVVENFTYKVMDNLGIGYDDLRKAKPDIILASMPPMGKSGPFAPWTTYGQQLMGFSGMTYLWGYPDSPMEAHPKIPYPDDTAAAQTVFAILAALEHRDRTGEGQFVEIAQGEGLAYMLTPAYLDYLINGRIWEARGNWHPVAAPFGVYRCAGRDAWLAISCETEEHWQGLARGLEKPEWAQDPRFRTIEDRREHKAELDGLIEQETASQTPRAAMWVLQRAGAPAFEVSTNEDLYHDLHLRQRGYIRRGSFPGWEDVEYRGPAVAMSELGERAHTAVAKPGQHNYEVFGALLGLSREEVDRLAREKAIY